MATRCQFWLQNVFDHGPVWHGGLKRTRRKRLKGLTVSSWFLSKTVPFRATGPRNFIVVPVPDQRRRMSRTSVDKCPGMSKAIASSRNCDWTSPDCSRNATHSAEAHQVCGCWRRNVVQGRRNDVLEDGRSQYVVLCRGKDQARKMAECHVTHFCSLPERTQSSVEANAGEAMRWWWRLVELFRRIAGLQMERWPSSHP